MAIPNTHYLRQKSTPVELEIVAADMEIMLKETEIQKDTRPLAVGLLEIFTAEIAMIRGLANEIRFLQLDGD